MFELHIPPEEWDRMSLSDKGRFIAFYQLRNMVQLIEQHEMYQEQDRQAEMAGNAQ